MEPRFSREELIFIKRAAMLLGSYLFLLLLIASSGCIHQGDQPSDFRGVVPVTQKTIRYTIKAGETLWRISQNYGVPLDRLAGINGIEDPTKILSGTVLIIPIMEPSVPTVGAPALKPLPSITAALSWPLKGKMMRGFSDDPDSRHDGIDIANTEGTLIRAAAAGRVAYSGDQFRGYGNLLIIEHTNELSTIYAHCSELLVYEGDEVPADHIIAKVGKTGNATAPHLHFEVRLNNTAVDPIKYLPSK